MKFYRLAYPRMVVLATCQHKDKDNIITLAWHAPLSFDPPLYAISITPKRFSHNLIKKSGEFAVNFIDSTLQDQALYCGTHSGRDVDKFSATKLSRKKANHINVPLINEAAAWLECKVVETIDTGDHTLFVGKVFDFQKTDNSHRLYDKGGRNFTQL